MKLEIHRVTHHNRTNENEPDHSWTPIVDGKIILNPRHADGFFFGLQTARVAISRHVGKPLDDLDIRIVK